jgi:hypothetical protein
MKTRQELLLEMYSIVSKSGVRPDFKPVSFDTFVNNLKFMDDKSLATTLSVMKNVGVDK